MSGKAQFEVFEAKNGDFRWRLRDKDGEVVHIKPGKIFGLGTAKDLKPYRDAANTVLSYHLKANGKPGSSKPAPTGKG